MKNKIIYTSLFSSRYKRLNNKFPDLCNELAALQKELELNPFCGTALGSNLYKIRIAGKGKGKSGSFRVITYLINKIDDSFEINFIIIYDKSEESSIDKTTLLALVKKIFN